MIGRIQLLVVGVFFMLAFSGAAGAQSATASLTPVESGRIDAGSGAGYQYRAMCLRQGLYVLAFRLGEGSWAGSGMVVADESEPTDPAATVFKFESEQDRWGWNSFEVDNYTCFRLGAQNGRARVYMVRVGVNW